MNELNLKKDLRVTAINWTPFFSYWLIEKRKKKWRKRFFVFWFFLFPIIKFFIFILLFHFFILLFFLFFLFFLHFRLTDFICNYNLLSSYFSFLLLDFSMIFFSINLFNFGIKIDWLRKEWKSIEKGIEKYESRSDVCCYYFFKKI